MKSKNDSFLFRISLLSISTLLMLAPAIAPTLPLMIEDFSNQPQAVVELLLTVPNFGIILAIFLSLFFVKILGKKNTVILGLLISLISGVTPMVCDVFQVIFVARFLFGFGVGLFNSLAVSLLAEFYEGDRLATMMGFQSVAGSVGAAVASFFVGFFITRGWQESFSIYLIIIPVIILFGVFVPIEKDKKTEIKKVIKEKQSLNMSVLYFVFLIFFIFTFYMVIPVKLPELVMIKELGTMSSVSFITGISTLIGIPVGIFYGKIYRLLKSNVIIFGLIMIIFGITVITLSSSFIILAMGVTIFGIGFGLTIPFIYTEIAKYAPQNSVNLAYTAILISTNVGVFTSPIIINFLGTMFNLTDAQGSMIIAIMGFFILLCLVFIYKVKKKVLVSITD